MRKTLVNMVVADLPGKILHTMEINGTVAIVEQRGEVRYYHAREFTRDGGEWVECGGYSTADKYWYMGERYRSRALWGKYLGEVFYVNENA